MTTKFKLEVSFNDGTGQPVAAYLRIRKGDVAETREVQEGVAFADYDNTGVLLGIELLAPCRLAVLDDLSQTEPESVRRFLRGGLPCELIAA